MFEILAFGKLAYDDSLELQCQIQQRINDHITMQVSLSHQMDVYQRKGNSLWQSSNCLHAFSKL